MRTRIAASRSIDVIVLIQPSNYFCDFSSKIHALKDKKKTSYVIFRRIYLRGRKHPSILDEISDKSTIFHAWTEHISPRISSFSAVTRVPGTITHKPSYHRMQRMPSILANPPLVRSRFRIEDQRDERSFLDFFSFLSLPSLRRVGRVKQEGWRAEVEGERERGEGRRN